MRPQNKGSVFLASRTRYPERTRKMEMPRLQWTNTQQPPRPGRNERDPAAATKCTCQQQHVCGVYVRSTTLILLLLQDKLPRVSQQTPARTPTTVNSATLLPTCFPCSWYCRGAGDGCLTHHLHARLGNGRVAPDAHLAPAGCHLLDGERHSQHVHHRAQLPAVAAAGRGHVLHARVNVFHLRVEDAHDPDSGTPR